jgi:hypothetical protein
MPGIGLEVGFVVFWCLGFPGSAPAKAEAAPGAG